MALLITLSIPPLAGQNGDGAKPALSPVEIVTLHQSGLSAGELLKALDHGGVTELDAASLETLKRAGVPEAVITRLAPKKAASKAALSLDDVLNLVKSGVPDDEVARLVVDTGSTFELRIDDVVALVKSGLSPGLIRLLRERDGATRAVQTATEVLTLDRIGDLFAAGTSGEEILQRLRKDDVRCAVTADDLIRLSRMKVPSEVLKELWARRTTEVNDPPPPGSGAGKDAKPAAPAPAAPQPGFTIHRESSGGFSLNVPDGWFVHRENAGANALVSFTDTDTSPQAALPDCEIQVFRYRSPTPERLTETNLEPIAANFLGRLQATYAAKKMTLTFGRWKPLLLSGRPAVVTRVASSAHDGTTHEGEIFVSWAADQVYVVSFAVRAEAVERLFDRLGCCARSFTIETDRLVEIAAGKPEETLASLFEAWKTAVRSCDFAVFRKIVPAGCDTPLARQNFVALSRRLAADDVRLSLGNIRAGTSDAEVECRILSPAGAETMTLAFEKVGTSFRLKP